MSVYVARALRNLPLSLPVVLYSALVAPLMALNGPDSLSARDHFQRTLLTPPSGSVTVALALLSSCGRPGEIVTAPASSTFVTFTVGVVELFSVIELGL